VAPTKLRAIIFDIGRVLIRVDVARAMERLAAGHSLSPEAAWASLEKDPRWKDWQEGRMSPRDWHLHVAKRLGSSLSFDQFTEAWNAALDPYSIQDQAFLEKLSKRYRLGLLSNTDPIHVAHMEATYEFFRLFPARIYSCQVGASKPNPLIYREALRACKVNAEEALYIDDVPAYVEAAQRLGMSGIPFQSPDQLAADLRTHGVILD
jgi:HAD superfamily hydrolase (TIGR01509 family)